MSVLNNSDLTLYATDLAAYATAGTPYTVGAAFIIINNCQPKCPPESLNALADYINRVRDGVQDLYFRAETPPATLSPFMPTDTTGTAAATTATSYNFTALSFASTTSDYPSATGFVKYFHEGMPITITYGAGNVQTANIVSIISATQITVDTALTTTTSSGTASFVIGDFGIYNTLNNAIALYNTDVATNLNIPSGQILYTSTEGYNELGEYGTYLLVVAAIYNPTNTSINFTITFSASSELTLENNTFKLRQTDGTVEINPTFPYELACKDYDRVEGVYFIPCGPETGTLDITIAQNTGISTVTVLNGTTSIPINSTDCTSGGSQNYVRVPAYYNVGFSYTITGFGTGTLVVDNTTLPPWIDPITGVDLAVPPTGDANFTGTPTDTINTNYLITALLYSGTTVQQINIIINVLAPPVVTSATVTAFVGSTFSYPVIATNAPSFSATGLPSTLTIDTSTGVITGIPEASDITGSPYTIDVTASNTNLAGSGSGNGTLDLIVGYSAPSIYSTLAQMLTQGVPFSYQILATNAPSGSTYSASGLTGTGLSINTSTGVISGTVSVGISTISSVIRVNGPGGFDSATLVLTVGALPPVITSPLTASGTVGISFSYTITSSPIATSYPSVSGLPPGITQSGATLSGTPTGASGTYPITIAATNSGGTGSQLLTISITSLSPSIISPLTISAIEGVPITYNIIATNNPTSYSQSGIPGTLSMNAGGQITGTLTSTGVTSFSITASNVYGADTETLKINTAPAAAPIVTSPTTVAFSQGLNAGYTITATNYPTSYNVGSYPLPAGLSISSTTGLIYGIPVNSGTFPIRVYASNTVGTGSQSLTINIAPEAPVIVSSSIYGVKTSGKVSYVIVASNFPSSYGVTGQPSWLSITGNTVSGTAGTIGTYTMVVSATNGVGTTNLTVTINVT